MTPAPEAERLAVATGWVIYRIRLRTGLSQQDLADSLGIDRSAVSRWEHGQRCPTLLHLTLVGALAGRRASSLLNEVEDLMRPPQGTDQFEDGFGPDGPDWLDAPGDRDEPDRPLAPDRPDEEDDDAADD